MKTNDGIETITLKCPSTKEVRGANGKDLGTYHLRVEFSDGRGFIQSWTTGRRFSHGTENVHPLTAEACGPIWEDEDELFGGMVFLYLYGNYSDGDNWPELLYEATGENADAEGLKLRRLTAIRPDGSEQVIWNET